MKKLFRITMLCAATATFAFSCTGSQHKKTIENLKAAITGETGASAKYQTFSLKAAADGYHNIAKMFAAASRAEAIHINNHNNVLVKLNRKPFSPTVEATAPSDIVTNIRDAIDGETFEFTVMYPTFIVDATVENCNDAVASFSMASGAEANHAMLYTKVLHFFIVNGNDALVSPVWYVCPKCGDLFDSIEGLGRCPICGVHSTAFEQF